MENRVKLVEEAKIWVETQLPKGPWADKHIVNRLIRALKRDLPSNPSLLIQVVSADGIVILTDRHFAFSAGYDVLRAHAAHLAPGEVDQLDFLRALKLDPLGLCFGMGLEAF